MMLSSGLY
ncbi:hypothetical protein EC900091_5265, partial [Escherichia coli 90.0091]